MAHRRGLAVHQPAAHHLAAEILSDRLVAEAHAEQRLARIRAGADEIEADPRLVGRAGAGRQEKRLRAAELMACPALIASLRTTSTSAPSSIR
jgi:hypothetical protein